MACASGDLKGGNVLMKSTSMYDDPRGFVCKLGDFGLSRVLDSNSTHVSTGTYGECRHTWSSSVMLAVGMMSHLMVASSQSSPLVLR